MTDLSARSDSRYVARPVHHSSFLGLFDAGSVDCVKEVVGVTSCEARSLDWLSFSSNTDLALDCCELWGVDWEKEADRERSKLIPAGKLLIAEQINL